MLKRKRKCKSERILKTSEEGRSSPLPHPGLMYELSIVTCTPSRLFSIVLVGCRSHGGGRGCGALIDHSWDTCLGMESASFNGPGWEQGGLGYSKQAGKEAKIFI